jgi:hypothetical protein
MKLSTKALVGLFGIVLGLASTASQAQTTTNVSNGGTLTSSIGLLSTSSGADTNNLLLLPYPSTTGFNFSGTTGSNTALNPGGAASTGGYFYTDYLIDVTPGSAEAVTTTLTNSSGVANLNERIYQVSGSGNTFLGDASAAPGVIQAWSTNYPNPGSTLSYIAPVDLTAAGLYVLEIRGTSAGNFGGTLSITAVPEASASAMLMAGLALLGFAVLRRRA